MPLSPPPAKPPQPTDAMDTRAPRQAPTSVDNQGPQLAPPSGAKATPSASGPGTPPKSTAAEQQVVDALLPTPTPEPQESTVAADLGERLAKLDPEALEFMDDAFEAGGVWSNTALERPISEQRELDRPLYRKITSTIISVLLFFPSLLVEGLSKVTEVLSQLVGEVLSAIVTGFMWLAGKVLGLDTDKAIASVRQAIKAGSEAVFGLIEGSARLPTAIASTTLMWLEDVFSFSWATSGREAMGLLTKPIIGTLTSALSPLFYGLKRMDDALHPWRRVNSAERAALALDYPQSLIDGLRIHDGRQSWVFAIFGAYASAQTMGDDIYLEHPDLPLRRLIRHEAVHTLQTRDYNPIFGGDLPTFIGRYMGDLVAGLFVTGFDTHTAYQNSPAELQAHLYEIGVKRRVYIDWLKLTVEPEDRPAS